jgi:hypothetical protein
VRRGLRRELRAVKESTIALPAVGCVHEKLGEERV